MTAKGIRTKFTARFLSDFLKDFGRERRGRNQDCSRRTSGNLRQDRGVYYSPGLAIETSASLNELSEDDLDQMIGQLRQRALEQRPEATDVTPRQKVLTNGR